MSTTYDAIVVGAGLAGVTAARELRARGLRTVILEGRGRIGGRAWTAPFAGGEIEMGGQNVYWGEPFLWSEITRYRLSIAECLPFATYAVYEGDELRRYPAAEAAVQLGGGFEAFFGDHKGTMPRPYDPTFEFEKLAAVDGLSIQARIDQLDLSPDVLRWLAPWVAMRTGGAPDTGGFGWLLHIWALAGWRWQNIFEASGHYRLEGGTQALLKAMLADSHPEVMLDTPVAQVLDDGDRVAVSTASGDTYTAPVAVIATSGNMWSQIDFASGISEVKLQASRTGLQTPNCFTKLWALVDGEVDNLYVQRPDYQDHPLIHLRKDMRRPDGLTQVIAFSVNPSLDTNDPAAIEQAFRDMIPLDDVRIVDVTAHDWVSDPMTRGGTSLLRPGQLSQIDEITAPEGRLSFATADIATSTPGFDGAIQTGIRAAAEALATLGDRRSLAAQAV